MLTAFKPGEPTKCQSDDGETHNLTDTAKIDVCDAQCLDSGIDNLIMARRPAPGAVHAARAREAPRRRSTTSTRTRCSTSSAAASSRTRSTATSRASRRVPQTRDARATAARRSAILVAINPFKKLPLYTPEQMELYRDGSRGKAPHIFGIGIDQGGKSERHSQLQRLLARPFSTRFG